MIDKYMYTDSQIQKLLKSIVVFVDTREKANSHILDGFDAYGIEYKKKALDFGDYSFMLPKNEELGINQNMSFEKDIIIERKNSAEELALCFTKQRVRFESEFIRAKDAKKYLLIENCSYSDIVDGNYKSEYKSNSFLAGLHSFNHRYDLDIVFIPDKSYTSLYIAYTFYYYLREIIK